MVVTIDKNNPKYGEYIEKCKAISKEYDDAKEEILSKYPKWRGFDHPGSAKIKEISDSFSSKLKSLQQEYAYLFLEKE